MRRLGRYLALVVVGLLTLLSIGGTGSIARFEPDGNPDVKADVVVTMVDDAVEESSGLVVRGNRIYTINDSGDGPFVYAVDTSSGEVAAVTQYDDEDPFDVEAIAPGRRRSLWVGDIGDNQRVRGSIRVFRMVPSPSGGVVPADTFDLDYPDGPHDAETLLVHPRTGRLLVVSKRPIVGGEVYQAPRDLEPGRMHRLTQVASVPGFVTDGAFFPDGRHVVLRTYGDAAVYTYPGFDMVGAFELPAQEQGEGIAVGKDGRLYLSSEEVPSPILAMDVPAKVAAAMESGAAPGDGGAGRERPRPCPRRGGHGRGRRAGPTGPRPSGRLRARCGGRLGGRRPARQSFSTT